MTTLFTHHRSDVPKHRSFYSSSSLRLFHILQYTLLGILCFILCFIIISAIFTYYLCHDCQHRKYTYDFSLSLRTNHSSTTTSSSGIDSTSSSSSVDYDTKREELPAQSPLSSPISIPQQQSKHKLRKRRKRRNTSNPPQDIQKNEELVPSSNNHDVRTLVVSSSSADGNAGPTVSSAPTLLTMVTTDPQENDPPSLLPKNDEKAKDEVSLPINNNTICTAINTILFELPVKYRSDLCSLYTKEYSNIMQDETRGGIVNYPQLHWRERLSKILYYYRHIKSFVTTELSPMDQEVLPSTYSPSSSASSWIMDNAKAASFLVAQGNPSPITNESVWNTTILSPSKPLSRTEVYERFEWGIQCRRSSRSLSLSSKNNPSLSRTAQFYHISYFELKEIAMRLYHATNYLWIPKPFGRGPPLVNAGFYGGPWLEEYWYYTFVTPVRRNITLAEYQYHIRRHIKGMKLLSNQLFIFNHNNESNRTTVVTVVSTEDRDMATLNVDEYKDSIPESGRKGHRYILYELEQSEIKNDIYPLHVWNYTSTINNNHGGIPFVTVEEPFDFQLFYPYVPLFIPWDRIALYYKSVSSNIEDLGDNHHQYVSAMDKEVGDIEELLLSFTYTHIHYITVVQRAAGIFIRNKNLQLLIDNTIQINAGGGGDIPVPLLANEHSLLPSEYRNPERKEWKHWLTFLGTAREGVRQNMMDTIQNDHPWYKNNNGTVNFTSASNSLFYTNFYSSSERTIPKSSSSSESTSASSSMPSWIEKMSSSFLQLAPRGTNPSSFRIYEVLQLGLIPVYIYDNQSPWLPYQPMDNQFSFWNRTGFILHIDYFLAFLDFLPLLAQEYSAEESSSSSSVSFSFIFSQWYRIMLERIERIRSNYFTYTGIVRHIYRLLRDPFQSELYCRSVAQDYTKIDPFQPKNRR